ncbi:hypothetical protein MUK42_37082 [Musa troglodytarum]|uniref:Uncharacterized protein n=1 Tax=Musa troglodytarum TaxID=320322 RepID=A0A9E7JAC5_9LILI|nr:hypothetical protein MUK42_37082 [Musa troglodytarum]
MPLCRSTSGFHLRCHHVPSEAVAAASDVVVVANPAINQMAIQGTVDLILLSPIQVRFSSSPPLLSFRLGSISVVRSRFHGCSM